MQREPFDPERVKARRDDTGDPELEALAHRVIGCAIAVHRALGPGFPEEVYARALALELEHHGIRYQREAPIRVLYRGQIVGEGSADMVVESVLVLEFKAVDRLHPVHGAQALAYVKVLNLRLALVMNFNVAILKEGIERIINS